MKTYSCDGNTLVRHSDSLETRICKLSAELTDLVDSI